MSEGQRFRRPPNVIDEIDLANGPELTIQKEKKEALANLLRAVAEVQAQNGIQVDAGNLPLQPATKPGSTTK